MITVHVEAGGRQEKMKPGTVVPSRGVPVSWTGVPTGKTARHVPVPLVLAGFEKSQSMPAGLDVTRPRPNPPVPLTTSLTVPSGRASKRAKASGTLGG
jgi:hypothetical protein